MINIVFMINIIYFYEGGLQMKRYSFYLALLSLFIGGTLLPNLIYSQNVIDYTRNINLDGQIISLSSEEIRYWAEGTIDIDVIAEENTPKRLSKNEIRALANEFGLLNETGMNSHLSFLGGDISYWYEQKLSKNRLKLEFAARKAVLEAANEQGIVIDDQGKLSWAAQQIRADMIKEKKKLE